MTNKQYINKLKKSEDVSYLLNMLDKHIETNTHKCYGKPAAAQPAQKECILLIDHTYKCSHNRKCLKAIRKRLKELGSFGSYSRGVQND